MTALLVSPPDVRPIPTEYVVQSDLLGPFTIRPESAIAFPHGLLGFPECRHFALVRAGTDALYWLQSLDYAALVFLLVDPFPHFHGYVVDLPPADVLELGGADSSELAVLAIVTLPPPDVPGARPTVNLQGPVTMNLRTRRGKQIICADADHGVRRPLDLDAQR